uniref:DNA replication licensing factor MCM5 n=1 Tax=Aureoumbra lagunensis TaxID=44058 RepID=A0A7S3JYN2_9STRA|eukprot:CAMPEP_0197310528 /NCGR_PEP_ID=MMETSP0891-20130614/9102_1 /TAXON_ID=44058 ORGANISM="Aureoumbra lagunensis, Strain CCMP1510" /NCGR_SAMPLE_ID=MMETSP0891 /ASSEMBLY_ACC=CAM_ASM_000534 /LENGTH=811 /DNA_ID=CAMNT_0042796211 /DNA_START=25 /DNA_END=2460 /DNA_ORIENTATION=+
MQQNNDNVYVNEGNNEEGPSGEGIYANDDEEEELFINNFEEEELSLNKEESKKRFKAFVREFRRERSFIYREQLLKRWRLKEYQLEIELEDLNSYDMVLCAALRARPEFHIEQFESGAKEILRESILEEGGAAAYREVPVDDVELFNTWSGAQIQITLKSDTENGRQLRSLSSKTINKLIKICGIVTSATKVKNKAIRCIAVCSSCKHRMFFETPGPFQQPNIPKKCQGPGRINNEGKHISCTLQNPYLIIGDLCSFVDQQSLKLQERQEDVPTGEMPRSCTLVVDRNLVDLVAPGARISVLAISSLFESRLRGSNTKNNNIGLRTPYLKVLGIQSDDPNGINFRGNHSKLRFTPRDEERFIAYARRPDIHDVIARSIAPAISGDYTVDIKKAIASQLMGGSRKEMNDGAKLRGDINVLLLGDPSTAKSQFLKFVEKAAPVGVYTSGKGSSAAGLTASVIRDAKKEFYLEGGAMVLADGGICCIDEFDKMRENDRVAIHEAMEQQTISIAKAGICTVLNSRTSVLAAANPVFGRYDDLKSAAENIDMMTTILSRFDLIFIVRDVRDEARDTAIAKHVMGIHIRAGDRGEFAKIRKGNQDTDEQRRSTKLQNNTALQLGDPDDPDLILEPNELKQYVAYCRAKCEPRLSEETSRSLAAEYVAIRQSVKRQADAYGGRKHQAVPITVRQLEALVRISESIAKMRLNDEVQPIDAQEALRLFKVSTMAAARTRASGPEADLRFLSNDLRTAVGNAETFIKQRLPVGNEATIARLIEEAIALGHQDIAVRRSIQVMMARAELQDSDRGRKIKRLR